MKRSIQIVLTSNSSGHLVDVTNTTIRQMEYASSYELYHQGDSVQLQLQNTSISVIRMI